MQPQPQPQSHSVSKTPVARGDADGFAEELVGGWPYYSSKVEAERLSVEAANRLDVPLVILRPSSILGPGEVASLTTPDTPLLHTSLSYSVQCREPQIPSVSLCFLILAHASPHSTARCPLLLKHKLSCLLVRHLYRAQGALNTTGTSRSTSTFRDPCHLCPKAASTLSTCATSLKRLFEQW